MTESSKSFAEKALPYLTAASLFGSAVSPIAVAYIVSRDAGASVNKDYVGFAVQVLNSHTSTPAMKAWATKLLREMSPIGMDETTASDLGRLGTGGFRLPPPPVDLNEPHRELKTLGDQPDEVMPTMENKMPEMKK